MYIHVQKHIRSLHFLQNKLGEGELRVVGGEG